MTHKKVCRRAKNTSQRASERERENQPALCSCKGTTVKSYRRSSVLFMGSGYPTIAHPSVPTSFQCYPRPPSLSLSFSPRVVFLQLCCWINCSKTREKEQCEVVGGGGGGGWEGKITRQLRFRTSWQQVLIFHHPLGGGKRRGGLFFFR
jgi:hypothetical protein